MPTWLEHRERRRPRMRSATLGEDASRRALQARERTPDYSPQWICGSVLSAQEGGLRFTQSDPGGQRQSQAPAAAGLASVCPSQALPPPHSTGPSPQAGLQTLWNSGSGSGICFCAH